MVLTRDSIRNGIVQEIIAQAGDSIRPLTEAEVRESQESVLGRLAPGEDLWIFGYGSLIWNPAFHFEEQRLGRIFGYHRRFCLRTMAGRGSKARPGLMLALDRGGSCGGVVFRIAHQNIEEETEVIWRREMISGSYIPRWLKVRTPGGEVQAVAFVINHDHERYTGELPHEEMVEILAHARGTLGACSDYLFNTTAHLEAMGIGDRKMKRLSRAVAARQGLKAAPSLAELEAGPKGA